MCWLYSSTLPGTWAFLLAVCCSERRPLLQPGPLPCHAGTSRPLGKLWHRRGSMLLQTVAGEARRLTGSTQGGGSGPPRGCP
jgi:hypothetical protein